MASSQCGERRTTVGDAADRPGVTAQPEPSVADHQFRAGQRRGLGVAEQVGDELAGRPAGSSSGASMLAAKAVTRPSVAPAATRASWAEAWARLRPPVVVASVRVTSRTGRPAPAA